MPDMHRAGRVGRDVFDIDLAACPHRGAAVIARGIENVAKPRLPEPVGQPDVDETGTGNLDGRHVGIGLQCLADLGGQVTRRAADRLGQDHRRIGRKIAMRGIARRLDGDAPEIERAAVPGLEAKRFDGGFDPRAEIRENVHSR